MTAIQKTKKAKEARRKQAEERQAAHNALPLQDKIDYLVSRPGESKRELTKLYAEMKAAGGVEVVARSARKSDYVLVPSEEANEIIRAAKEATPELKAALDRAAADVAAGRVHESTRRSRAAQEA